MGSRTKTNNKDRGSSAPPKLRICIDYDVLVDIGELLKAYINGKVFTDIMYTVLVDIFDDSKVINITLSGVEKQNKDNLIQIHYRYKSNFSGGAVTTCDTTKVYTHNNKYFLTLERHYKEPRRDKCIIAMYHLLKTSLGLEFSCPRSIWPMIAVNNYIWANTCTLCPRFLKCLGEGVDVVL